MPSIRIQRFEKELLKLMSRVVSYKLRDKNLAWVSITRVKLSPDLSYARVYFTHITNTSHEKVLDALKRCTGVIKHEIASAKMMRVIPDITFFYDDLEERADQLEEIFQKIHQEEENPVVEPDETE
ncbi:MAG: 30S ribosome-binding factor RbfA [Candidatus Cloacimonetes bacterium]|nr:30S ribosome-binding factor RbfA [Candidatus Cloacimonadota bacterium]